MSVNRSRRQSKAPAVATFIMVIAAIAAVAVRLAMNKGGSGNSSGGAEQSFGVTQAFADECTENAQRLIAENYTVARLFVLEGLPYDDEPYGNRPEDGYFTVSSDVYTSFGQIESLVRSVYTAEESDRILTRLPVTAESDALPETTAVYAPRKSYLGDEEVLGISERFAPYTSYSKPWATFSVSVSPTGEDECFVTVYLGADETAVSDVDKANILITKMIKENGEWRLCSLVY